MKVPLHHLSLVDHDYVGDFVGSFDDEDYYNDGVCQFAIEDYRVHEKGVCIECDWLLLKELERDLPWDEQTEFWDFYETWVPR